MPAVSTILFSVLAMCVAAASDLLMSGGLTRVAHEALVAAGPLGTGGRGCTAGMVLLWFGRSLPFTAWAPVAAGTLGTD